jgi:hypothetical protein
LPFDHFEQVVLGDVCHLPAGILEAEWSCDQAVVFGEMTGCNRALFLELLLGLE